MVFAMTVLGASAQNRSISGTVVDQSGVPVVGAAVVVVGNSTNGAVTDLDGKFSLSVPANARLEVSCIGYATASLTVGNQSVLSIVLAEDTELLEETVVIGYGVQKKSDLTGAVASVKSEDLQNRSTSDAAAALQGKAAGVQILNTSGAPGSGASIRVRGYSSNSGSIGPLLIVDGLMVDNIQYLDPSMIESMEVLKDAASAAIYGAQAGNGVVLITTKSGKSGHVSVSYDGKFTMQMLGKKAKVFEGDEYVEFQKYIGQIKDTELEANGWKPGTNYNWFDQVFDNSWAIQHAVTFQGGNDKGHFFTSLNYVDNDGIIIGKKDTYTRLTAQINADYKFYKWLTVGTNNSIEKYSRTSVSQSSYGSMLNSVMSLDPLTPAYYSNIEDCPGDVQAKYISNPEMIMRDPNHNNDFYGTSKYVQEATGSPLIQRDRTDATSGGINVRGAIFANLTPINGLVLTSRFGYRFSQSNSHSYSAPYYATGMANSTDYNISAAVNTNWYYQWENFANYNKTIGKHAIGAMVGMSFTESHNDNASMSASGVDVLKSYGPNDHWMGNIKTDSKVTRNMSNTPGTSTQMSYFGRLSYSFDNRYSIQANFRADAFDSSKLDKSTRWGYFPSFSAGWTLTNEQFVKNNINRDILSFLKIRGSWGRNGNVNILSGYPYVATISPNGQNYQYDPATGDLTYGSGPTKIPNPDLKWETSQQIDLGLDARMFRDRLSIGLDWYKKNTKGLLINYAPLPELGVKSVTANAGNVLNRGFEIELGWKDSVGDFSYSVNANLSTLKNKVLKLHSELDRIESAPVSGLNTLMRSVVEEGYPIWYMRGFKYLGADPATGVAKFADLDGNVLMSEVEDEKTHEKKTIINSDPGDEVKQMIGKGIPDFTYGLTINMEYKGFDLMVFGTGTCGNDIATLLYSADRPKSNSLSHFWRNSWKQAGDNTKYPDMDAVKSSWKFWSSSATLFNGSYFKIKQLQLGYTIPQKITKKILVNNFRVYVSLDDFFTFSSYPGCDPETATTQSASSMGYDCGTYPTSKKVVFGVNITF